MATPRLVQADRSGQRWVYRADSTELTRLKQLADYKRNVVAERIKAILTNPVYRPIDRSGIDDLFKDHADLAEILLRDHSIDWSAQEQVVPTAVEHLDGIDRSFLESIFG